MIKYLNRLKSKKGFTLVELVIVVIIIGVLITIMTASLVGGNTEKILAANSNAKSFLAATQLAFTRAQLTERELVNYGTEAKLIKYKDGVNSILDDSNNPRYMFVEARFGENGIMWLHLNYSLNGLMNMPDNDGSDMTILEKYFANNIDSYMNESYDGYFYAAVDDNFKVLFTHYCEGRLPSPPSDGDKDTFRNDLMVTNGKLKGNSLILGSCSDVYTIPETGDYAFDAPALTDPDAAKVAKYYE